MKFREFLVVAMVAVGTTIIIFDTLSGASKIGAGSSPSVHHSPSAQLSALTMPSSPPVQPESLAGSKIKQGAAKSGAGANLPASTKSKNVAPTVPKLGQWVKVEISTYSRSLHGNGTHSGERYDHYKGHTAATTIIGRRWVLPKGSVWEVEYPAGKNIVLKPGMTVAHDFETGKTTRVVTVRINDTGSTRPRLAPYWLDLSGKAWTDLTGIAPSRKVARMRRVK